MWRGLRKIHASEVERAHRFIDVMNAAAVEDMDEDLELLKTFLTTRGQECENYFVSLSLGLVCINRSIAI